MITNSERVFISFVGTASLAVTAAHGINAVIGRWSPALAQTSAAALTWTVIGVAAGFALCQILIRQPRQRLIAGFSLSIAGSVCFIVFGTGFGTASITVFLIGILETFAAERIASRLPASLDGVLAKHPVRSILWTVLGIVLLIQTGRLGTYMADPSVSWWLTTENEFWSKHMCMPAYIQAADYNRQGEKNVYDGLHYPAVTRNAKVHLSVGRMDAFAGDPYQYPPQFLLAPTVALWLTNDFLTMRTAWYCLQVYMFVLVAILLARWVRPEAGWGPMLLIPVVWISVPATQCFQYGQFHLATIVLAVAGMLAFGQDRHAIGGFLLAAAILSKLFPAILLVPLLVQRRWKPVLWTLGFACVLTIVSMIVVGMQPFHEFIYYQLPRLTGGEALTAFSRDWPEFRSLYTANVISLYGVVLKLRELGINGMSDGLALWIMRVYTLFILVVAVIAGRGKKESRLHSAWVWLALLNLAALQTTLAWGDYVTVGTAWLLSLMAVQLHRTILQEVMVWACWVFSVFNLGIEPVSTLAPITVMMIMTSVGAVLLPLLNSWIVLRANTKWAGEGALSKR